MLWVFNTKEPEVSRSDMRFIEEFLLLNAVEEFRPTRERIFVWTNARCIGVKLSRSGVILSRQEGNPFVIGIDRVQKNCCCICLNVEFKVSDNLSTPAWGSGGLFPTTHTFTSFALSPTGACPLCPLGLFDKQPK